MLKRFLAITLMLGFLVGCGESEPRPPMKFKVGQMIQTKVGEEIGQIIDTWRDGKYTIRFQRKDSEHGSTFVTNIMNGYELEKCSGSRC